MCLHTYKWVMESLLQQRTKQHIWVGPIFVLFQPFSYVRAANLVLHKLYYLAPHPPVSFLFQERDQFLTDVCTAISLFPFSTNRAAG